MNEMSWEQPYMVNIPQHYLQAIICAVGGTRWLFVSDWGNSINSLAEQRWSYTAYRSLWVVIAGHKQAVPWIIQVSRDSEPEWTVTLELTHLDGRKPPLTFISPVTTSQNVCCQEGLFMSWIILERLVLLMYNKTGVRNNVELMIKRL